QGEVAEGASDVEDDNGLPAVMQRFAPVEDPAGAVPVLDQLAGELVVDDGDRRRRLVGCGVGRDDKPASRGGVRVADGEPHGLWNHSYTARSRRHVPPRSEEHTSELQSR